MRNPTLHNYEITEHKSTKRSRRGQKGPSRHKGGQQRQRKSTEQRRRPPTLRRGSQDNEGRRSRGKGRRGCEGAAGDTRAKKVDEAEAKAAEVSEGAAKTIKVDGAEAQATEVAGGAAKTTKVDGAEARAAEVAGGARTATFVNETNRQMVSRSQGTLKHAPLGIPVHSNQI